VKEEHDEIGILFPKLYSYQYPQVFPFFSIILPLIIRGLCSSFHVGGEQMEEDWSIFGFLYGTIPPAPPTVIYAAAFGIEGDLVSTTVYI
jgi:predicted permease